MTSASPAPDAWHHEPHSSLASATVEHDPTQLDPQPLARPGRDSIGRRLLRQRMFPGETLPAAIGRYTVLRFVGAGGMGQVFAAYDPTLDRKVALKLLPAGLGGDPSQRTRLLREAQALAKLSHPNVVAVHEAGEHDERVYMVMEFVDGQTLDAWVAGEGEGGRRRPREILDMFIQAGRALAAAHAAGLVHRDFKPSNVLVDGRGIARVLDFGLVAGAGASHADCDDGELQRVAATQLRALDVELTTTGTILGTPAYMAPEQFAGAVVDARSDQFGFCVALFEALTGKRPFAGETVGELMRAVEAGTRQAPASGRRLPRRIQRALDRGLASAPAQRWPSMDALLDALQPRPVGRIIGVAAAVVVPVAAAVAWQTVDSYERELDVSAEQLAEQTEQAAVASTRAEQLSYEREVIDRARRAGEVTRLAHTPGEELDAIALGVEVLAEYGHDPLDPLDPSEPALAGLSSALAGVVPLASLDRSDRLIGAAAFSADGTRLVTTPAPASDNDELELWSTQPARLLRTIALDGLDVHLRAPIISGDTQHVVVSSDVRCVVFDLDTGARVTELRGCTDPQLSVDGRTLFAKLPCTDAGEPTAWTQTCAVAAWSIDDGKRRWTKALPGRSSVLRVHPDGGRLIVRHDYADNDAIELLSTETGERMARLVRPQAGRAPKARQDQGHVALSADGSTLAVIEHDGQGRAVAWDLTTLEPKLLDAKPPWGWVFADIALSRRGGELFVLGQGGGWSVHDIDSDRPSFAQSWSGAKAVALPGGWLAISGGEWIASPQQGPRQPAFDVHQLVASDDGRFVATISGAGSKLWSAGEHLSHLQWAEQPGERVHAFSATHVVARMSDGELRVYPRAATGEAAATPTIVDTTHLGRRPQQVAARRPTRMLFHHDGVFEVHELGAGAPLCRLPKSAAGNWVLGPEGRRVAALRPGAILVWDVETCSEQARVELPAGMSGPLRLGLGGTVHLRDASGRNFIHRSDGHEQLIDEDCMVEPDGASAYAVLSDDGRRLLSTCAAAVPEHNPGRVWDVDSGELLRELDLRRYAGIGLFSADATLLLFSAGRQTAVVRVADGRELFRVPGRLGQAAIREADGTVLDRVVLGRGLLSTPVTIDGLLDAGCELLARAAREQLPAHCRQP